MIHGCNNDISWTIQSTPIFLAHHGYTCFAVDLPGHSQSQGLKAFILDLNAIIQDSAAFFDSVIKHESICDSICLLFHLLHDCNPAASQFHGAVLAALICKIFDRIRPRWPIPSILTFVARLFPTLPVTPTDNLVDKSVMVQGKRIVIVSNPMRYAGKPRLGTVLELHITTNDLIARLSDVTIPIIMLHESADVVTDPDVSRELYNKAKGNLCFLRFFLLIF